MTEKGEPGAEKQKSETWRKVKKVLWWTLAVFFVVIGLLVWVGNNVDMLERKLESWRSERFEKALQKAENERNARLAADIDGGKTPEETIELFVAALERGDIEQASKYYVLEKQEEEFLHLKNDILGKYGDLQKSIDFYAEVREKGVKKCNEEGDGCTFEYEYVRTETSTTTAFISGQNLSIVSPAGSKGIKRISLDLNQQSNVWKIELP